MDRRTFLGSAALTAAAGAGFAAGVFRGDIATMFGRQRSVLSVPDVTVLEMHFRALRGVGWRRAEKPTEGKVLEAVATKAPYDLDGTWIDVDKPDGFVAGQLVTIRGADGIYRSSTIHEVNGRAIRFQQSIRGIAEAGASIFNFYLNDAHPHVAGYYTIADDAAAQLNNPFERVQAVPPFGTWSKIGNVAWSVNVAAEYQNPGAAFEASEALQVTVPSNLDGIVSKDFILAPGLYRLSLPLAIARTTGYGTMVRVDIDIWDPAKRAPACIASNRLRSQNGVFLAEVPFTLLDAARVRVSVVVEDGPGVDVTVGYGHILKSKPSTVHLSKGTTVLLGDSWINRGAITKRFKQKWYPNGNFIQSAVPGNNFTHLLERFDIDVIPHKPRNVLVMCGTNDAYKLPTVQQFQDQVAILREKIRAIGAQPVFWDCSVCDRNYVDGDRLTPSRVLAIGTDFNGTAPYPTA